MKSAKSARSWEEVKKIRSSEVRKSIPQDCYPRSLAKTFSWYIVDFLIFALGMVAIFSSSSIIVKFAGGLLSGVGVAMLFLWAHDAAHGTLFKNSKVAEFLGTAAMLPSLNIFRMWSYGHNKVHHGFTSFSPIDWIWRPLTPKQYKEKSFLGRVMYRLERNFFTCAIHYLYRIWWKEMLHYNPGKCDETRRYYRNGKWHVLVYAIIASVIAYLFAGGVVGILAVVVLPFIVFNYFIAMIVYLHHTHPEIPFFDLKKDWSHAVGALYCSTIINCSKVSKLLLHNIMIHIPHHLDTRIPFYHLPRAYEALKKEYGEYIHEYRFRWSLALKIFRKCQLYDFENKLWMTFKEGKTYKA